MKVSSKTFQWAIKPGQEKVWQFTAFVRAYKDVNALEIKMRPEQENVSFNHKLTVPLSNKPEVSLIRVGKRSS